MLTIEIEKEYNIKDVAHELSTIRFGQKLTVEEVNEIIDHVPPSDYRLFRDVLSNYYYSGEVPDRVVRILNTELTATQICGESGLTVSKEIMDSWIENDAGVSFDVIVANNRTDIEVLKRLFDSNTAQLFGYSLGAALGEAKNVELAKYIISKNSSLIRDAHYIKRQTFMAFGSLILSEDDEIALFGKPRPMVSGAMIYAFEPCVDGWKRARNWTSKSGESLPWSTFVAKHLLANLDVIDDAKADLEWLATQYVEENSLFD